MSKNETAHKFTKEGREFLSNVDIWQLLTLRSAIKLEIAGMSHSRGSAYAQAKRTYGIKGNKRKVLDQLNEMILVIENQKKLTDHGTTN
tara:strand:+ start:1731 stop:1997 length:267 start_codon:yes stop_codon:yes gene_type:complete